MKIQKTELAQKISKLKSVVPKQTATQVLQGILVKDGCLIASNMEMTVKAKIEGADGESFIIPAKAFDLIANLPDGEVEIAPGKDNTIKISAEKIKNTYQTMDSVLFPLPELPEGNENDVMVESEKLLASMKRVSYAIPSKSTDMRMTSLCMKAAEGILDLVGMDGHVLAWDKAECSGDFEMLIPKNTVDKLLTVGLSGKIGIRHSKQSAVFETEDYEVYTRLVEGKYYPYQSMIRETPFGTVVSRMELADAMLRAKLCTEEKTPVRWSIDGDCIDIRVKDAAADYQETVSIQEEIREKIVIGFDARLVIETLKAFDCPDIRLSLSGSKMPMIVDTEDGSFKALVLPVLIR